MFKNLKIKSKLILLFLLIGILPVAVVGFISLTQAKHALEERAVDQYVSIREMKSRQIHDYFQTIREQVMTFSNDFMIIDAMRQFKQAFPRVTREVDGTGVDKDQIDHWRNQLAQYYRNDYAAEYRSRNQGHSPDINRVFDPLDDQSIVLQYKYIWTNPNPLGSKDQLDNAGDGSEWSALHDKYHEHIRHFLDEFGYYDIFLCDSKTGDIVYSVYKELDFTTSLINGPYANTGIGRVFKKANASSDPNFVAIDDFNPYPPSYEDQAGFIASPIYDEGEKLGVLIFQMPIDRINALMTNDQRWSEVGLGESGETYIIGEDLVMRSDSRFLIEDHDGYMEALENAGLDNRTIDLIDAKNTSIGLHKINSETARKALAGQHGTEVVKDYRGEKVLSSYSQIDIEGLNWALLAEIDESEAFAATRSLQAAILMVACAIAGIVAVIGWFFARSIALPLSQISETAKAVSSGDINQKVEVESGDEIGELADSFRSLVDYMKEMAGAATKVAEGDLRVDVEARSEKDALGNAFVKMTKYLEDIIGELADNATQLVSAATEISSSSEQMAAGAKNQTQQAEQVATAIEEMTATIMESTRNASEASELAKAASDNANQGNNVVADTINSMQKISESAQSTSSIISDLAQASDKIGEIIGVINDIADQTNLLALNAAIEAARAGEQGRGFAVVADEVRKLAERTGKATGEIADMIKGIQRDSSGSVEAMTQVGELVTGGQDTANKAGESLTSILEASSRVMDMIQQIATASEEQSAAAEQISKNVEHISSVTKETAAGAEQSASAAEQLNRQAEGLKNIVGRFQLREKV
jgi:methyl-accepting chemotaxis protein